MATQSRFMRYGVLLAFLASLPVWSSSSAATGEDKGNRARKVSNGTLARARMMSESDRTRLSKPSQFVGLTGTVAPEETSSFTTERALGAVDRIERLMAGGAQVADWDSLKKAAGLIPRIRLAIQGFENGSATKDEVLSLTKGVAELENLEGITLKGKRHAAAYRPCASAKPSEDLRKPSESNRTMPEGTTTKINTGWILDQHVLDPAGDKTYPTLFHDYKGYDEGMSDITMGHSEHPSASTMFGWVWEVQSIYWTDITLVTDHANPSYCIMVTVSQDGGFTWLVYEILYDPTSATHPTSLDMINPKLAMDVTGTYDRFYIAYEYAKSSTDHDVYVYSETSVIDGGTADAQDAAVAVSTKWEGKPALAADYKTGETSFRVVAYEYAYSATDHDIRVSQSTGNGSTWSAPVDVAATAEMETNPALTAGATGDGSAGTPFTAYMHLAYNYDSSTTTSEVRYARAAHPGTDYPTGLSSAAKVPVLPSSGSPAWPYEAPAVAASHGGSSTITGGRVVVAADRLLPADQPATGDPSHYQLMYAVNTCNGATTCGNVSGCSPTLSLNWNAYYLDDITADYRFPALVVDGVGWVQGTSSAGQNGVNEWPEIFMGYYRRPLNSTSPYGAAEMLATDASNEKCAGFASGQWYLLTAAEKASDDGDRVVAKQGTVSAFNYFYGWPGICFNKNLFHPGAGYNDDVYFTTLGDNYIIDTQSSGGHITAWWSFYGSNQIGPWTYAWPAGFEWTLTADADEIDNGRYYTFSSWTTGATTEQTTIASDWCASGASCQTTSINILYDGGCLADPSEVTDVLGIKQGQDVSLTWAAPALPGDVGTYTVYRATSPTAAGNFASVGTSVTNGFVDTSAVGGLYYYLIVAGCGPYSGPWGSFNQ